MTTTYLKELIDQRERMAKQILTPEQYIIRCLVFKNNKPKQLKLWE